MLYEGTCEKDVDEQREEEDQNHLRSFKKEEERKRSLHLGVWRVCGVCIFQHLNTFSHQIRHRIQNGGK